MVVMDYLQRRGCQDMDQATRRSAHEERMLAFKERKHDDDMVDRMQERKMWAEAQAEERRIRATEWEEERRIRAEERAEERRMRAEERADDRRAQAEIFQLLAEERRCFAAQQEAQLKLMHALIDTLKK